MAIKVEQNCTRCRRGITVNATDFTEAQAIEDGAKAKEAGARKLAELVTTLREAGELPDVFAVQRSGDEVIVISQAVLCDESDAKRSCVKTAKHFVEQLETLPERAPRGSKKKAAQETEQEQ